MIAPPEQPSSHRRPSKPSYVRDATHLWADIPAFTAFAHEVQEAMVGPDLSYPDRQRLLERAAHYGIRRFDANLIIAMVQNRADSHLSPAEPSSKPAGWIGYALIALAVQATIVLLGWMVLRPVL